MSSSVSLATTLPPSISDSAYSFSVHSRASARWRSLMLWPLEPVK